MNYVERLFGWKPEKLCEDVLNYQVELRKLNIELEKCPNMAVGEHADEFDRTAQLLKAKRDVIRRITRALRYMCIRLERAKPSYNPFLEDSKYHVELAVTSLKELFAKYDLLLVNGVLTYINKRSLFDFKNAERQIQSEIAQTVSEMQKSLGAIKKSTGEQVLTGLNVSVDVSRKPVSILAKAAIILVSATLIYTNGDQAIPTIKTLMDMKTLAGL